MPKRVIQECLGQKCSASHRSPLDLQGRELLQAAKNCVRISSLFQKTQKPGERGRVASAVEWQATIKKKQAVAWKTAKKRRPAVQWNTTATTKSSGLETIMKTKAGSGVENHYKTQSRGGVENHISQVCQQCQRHFNTRWIIHGANGCLDGL